LIESVATHKAEEIIDTDVAQSLAQLRGKEMLLAPHLLKVCIHVFQMHFTPNLLVNSPILN
jgi:hypothetical protein